MARSDRLIEELSAFARRAAERLELADLLYELTERVAEVIAVPSAGVSLLDDGNLRHVASLNEVAAEIESAQERAQRGPCVDACRDMEVVKIPNLRDATERWPEVASTALAAGVVAVAGMPMHDGHEAFGALNLFDVVPRHWSDSDLARVGVLADVATSYVVNASRLQEERRMKEQLQHALDNRMIIEQAKGILADHHGISVDQAFTILRQHARRHNAQVRSVADAIVNLGMRLEHPGSGGGSST